MKVINPAKMITAEIRVEDPALVEYLSSLMIKNERITVRHFELFSMIFST